MDLIEYFSPQPAPDDIPQRMPSPFASRPHALARRASEALQQRISQTSRWQTQLQKSGGGKMFGVLVVQDEHGRVGFLSAFSGMLDQRWQQPGFVPPVFDEARRIGLMHDGESQLQTLATQIQALQQHPQRLASIERLRDTEQQAEQSLAAEKQKMLANKADRKRQRKQADAKLLQQLSWQSQRDKQLMRALKQQWQTRLAELRLQFTQQFEQPLADLQRQQKRLSQGLQRQLFDDYLLRNFAGQTQPLRDLFGALEPPGGSADCAAPKLLHFAAVHALKPLALAEFWVGAPATGTVRRAGHFYPPCRAKCQPILPFLLQGIEWDRDSTTAGFEAASGVLQPEIVLEDGDLLVLNKPSGLLSTPGKQIEHSVQSWLRQHFPDATGPLLVHRLDMATSGLMLAAKTARAHKKLQRQFIQRSIDKRYVALLSKPLSQSRYDIDLPLRVDLDDRPRQMVCQQFGKPAQTRVEVIERSAQQTRVYFHPHTGRTHQLRVHAAHHQGLNAPIVGDDLYGTPARRLCLHAERLRFSHPQTGADRNIQLPADF